MTNCTQHITISGYDTVTNLPFTVETDVNPIYVGNGYYAYFFNIPINGEEVVVVLANQGDPNIDPNVWALVFYDASSTATYLLTTSFLYTDPLPQVTSFSDYTLGIELASLNLAITDFSTVSACFNACVDVGSLLLRYEVPDVPKNMINEYQEGGQFGDVSLFLSVGQTFTITSINPVQYPLIIKTAEIIITGFYYSDSLITPNIFSFTQTPATPEVFGALFTGLDGEDVTKGWFYPSFLGLCNLQISTPNTTESVDEFLEDVLCIQTKLGVYADQYATKLSFGVDCCETLLNLTKLRLGLQILNRYDLRDIPLEEPFYNAMTYAEILLLKNKLLTF